MSCRIPHQCRWLYRAQKQVNLLIQKLEQKKEALLLTSFIPTLETAGALGTLKIQQMGRCIQGRQHALMVRMGPYSTK